MKVSFDLSLAKTEDLVGELMKRFPAGVLTVLYQPEGKPVGVLETSSTPWGRNGAEMLGLTLQAQEMALQGLRRSLSALRAPPEGPAKLV